jgi:hypothetical protein
MSNPLTFMNNFFQLNVQFIQNVQQLRTANDQLVEDPTLIDRYFALKNQGPGVPRTDITAADVTAAQDALVQVFFTLDSGSPTQKSKIYKMLP